MSRVLGYTDPQSRALMHKPSATSRCPEPWSSPLPRFAQNPLSVSSFVTIAIAAACAPPAYETGASASDGYPAIKILFPNPSLAGEDDADAPVCSTFTVVVDVDNWELSTEGHGGDPVDGEGHWHLYIDDPQLTTATAAPECPSHGMNQPVRDTRCL